MKGMKRLAQSAPDSNDSVLGSKRVMAGPLFDVHRAESSRQNLAGAPPALDARRAESSRQHVRALNTQFASWVHSQVQNHPDELWEDGVRDYLKHASNILENFRDVVDWLKANAAKAESVSAAAAPNAEKTPITEAKTSEINSQLNAKSGFAGDGSTVSLASSWSFGLLPSSQTSIFSGTQNGTPVNQKSIFPGSQNATPLKQDALDNPDGEDELEKPNSPSVKKTEEQGVLVVHEVKCKVFVKPDNPADGTWKDMGMGQLSIKCNEGASKASKESKPTVVVRNDVGKVILNALLYPGIKMNIQKSKIITIFHTLAAGRGQAGGNESGKDAVAAARTYLLRTKTEDEANKLAETIKEYAPTA